MEHWKAWSEADARLRIALPKPDDDKYARGVLGVIAGSHEFPGAAVLACEAAMRTGVGMVRYLGPESVQNLVLARRPEVVTKDGQVQAWLIGSGIDADSIERWRAADIQIKLAEAIPTLLDAGGLAYISYKTAPTLITPHARELAALLSSDGKKVSVDQVRSEPKKWARLTAVNLDVTVLLKGNTTNIASADQEFELPPAPTWLATAGTGDVLAGIIGALMATHQKEIADNSMTLAEIAATGCLIHAHAAQKASKGGPMAALDVAHEVPQVISDLLHKIN